MTTRAMLRDATTVARENVMIFVPTIAASIVFGVLSLLAHPAPSAATAPYGPGMGAGMTDGALIARSFGLASVLLVVGAIVSLLAHAMTLAMVKQSLDGSTPTLGSGFQEAKERIVALAIAAVVTGILIGVGMMLLLLPGLILAFLLMFTFAAVIASRLNAFAALKKSFRLTTGEFGESAVTFLIIIALGVVFAAVSLIVNLVPFLGAALSMVLGGVYTGYISIVLLMTYRKLEGPSVGPAQAQEEPQPES